MFTDNSSGGSLVSNKNYWSENQLISSPDKNLFTSTFEFTEFYMIYLMA